MPPALPKILHLVSDSTGETLRALARAALAPFEDAAVDLRLSVLIRAPSDLEDAIARIAVQPGLVFYTLAHADQRQRLEEACRALGVSALPVLDPVIARLAEYLGQEPRQRPGMQHRLDPAYFARIAALDFAIAHDDGATGDRLLRADVILTGVSRTSKTPTCIYLAYRGVKAANLPLVPGRAPDPALFEAMAEGIPVIGLIASPRRLSEIRDARRASIGAGAGDYADLDRIRAEIADARLFFDRHDIPVIDVTRRSIEETAAAILARLQEPTQC